jgi:hypothetical protein
MIAFYTIYSLVRNQFGSARIVEEGPPQQAFTNALRVIEWENSINLFVEQRIQEWFLAFPNWTIQFWNSFYGTAHFVVTLGVFIVLFVRRPDVFPLWRNTLAFTTALAIVGFSLFPLMPPRLLDEPCPPEAYGAACIPTPLRAEFGVETTAPSASSTRWPSTADRGRSIQAAWRNSRTSTPPCPASTSDGPPGARSRCGRSLGGDG